MLGGGESTWHARERAGAEARGVTAHSRREGRGASRWEGGERGYNHLYKPAAQAARIFGVVHHQGGKPAPVSWPLRPRHKAKAPKVRRVVAHKVQLKRVGFDSQRRPAADPGKAGTAHRTSPASRPPQADDIMPALGPRERVESDVKRGSVGISKESLKNLLTILLKDSFY